MRLSTHTAFHRSLYINNRLVAIPLPPLRGPRQFDHYFSASAGLLIVLRQAIRIYEPDTFPCSNNPICTYTPVGFHYEPASLDVPVTYHGFS